jgi:sugar phosphate permease
VPIYYGWIIVAAASLGMILTSPGQTYSVSIFIEHFIEDLGVSRSLISTLYTMGTLIGSFALPFVGQQIDKRGPRVMVGIITALFALACVYMGFIQNAVMLGVGFVLIRMLGQGSLGLVCTNVINHWWVRRRGTVLSIAGVLASLLGSGSFPSLVHGLINRFGWRTSYMLLGGLVAVVLLPVGIGLFRRQPEDFGLLPDGDEIDPDNKSDVSAVREENWTRAEAIRTAAFWVLGIAGASISMLSTGLHFHMVSIFEDGGLSASAAAAAFMPIAVTGAVVRIVAGYLVDRIPVRFILAVALVGQAVGLVMAPRLDSATSALIYGIILGITGSLHLTVSAVVWAKYFGRRHLGSITGVSSLIGIAGSALGPMPMGIARDLLGSYTLALTGAAALPLLLAIAVLFTRRPHKAAQVDTT